MFTLAHGRFTSFSGAVIIDPLHPDTSQITVDIDASSVDSAMAVRDAHLRGEEFFDVERHPRITFDPVVSRCSAQVITRSRAS